MACTNSPAKILLEPDFKPQPSTRVSKVEADNDTWVEYLTIADILNPRTNTYQLQIRSFFESKASRKKVWDEPPSGAKDIVWASESSKHMAEEQMKDLMVVEKTKGDGHDGSDGNGDANSKRKSKKRSFLKKLHSFRKNKKDKEKLQPRKLIYKEGSKTTEFVMGSPLDRDPARMGKRQNADDINLQLALAQSLGKNIDNLDETGISALSDVGHHGDVYTNAHAATAMGINPVTMYSESIAHSYPNNGHVDRDQDDDIAIAQALSLSEMEYKSQKMLNYDEEIAAVVEESKRMNLNVEPSSCAVENPAMDRKMTPEEMLSSKSLSEERNC